MTKDPGLKGNKQFPVAYPYKFKFVGLFFRTIQSVRRLDVILTVLYRIFLEAFLANFLNICFELLFNFLVSLNHYRVQPKYQCKNKYEALSLKTLTDTSNTGHFVIHIHSKCEGTVERQLMSVCLYLSPHCPASPSNTGRLGV